MEIHNNVEEIVHPASVLKSLAQESDVEKLDRCPRGVAVSPENAD
jgi:hypothetical protein